MFKVNSSIVLILCFFITMPIVISSCDKKRVINPTDKDKKSEEVEQKDEDKVDKKDENKADKDEKKKPPPPPPVIETFETKNALLLDIGLTKEEIEDPKKVVFINDLDEIKPYLDKRVSRGNRFFPGRNGENDTYEKTFVLKNPITVTKILKGDSTTDGDEPRFRHTPYFQGRLVGGRNIKEAKANKITVNMNITTPPANGWPLEAGIFNRVATVASFYHLYVEVQRFELPYREGWFGIIASKVGGVDSRKLIFNNVHIDGEGVAMKVEDERARTIHIQAGGLVGESTFGGNRATSVDVIQSSVKLDFKNLRAAGGFFGYIERSTINITESFYEGKAENLPMFGGVIGDVLGFTRTINITDSYVRLKTSSSLMLGGGVLPKHTQDTLNINRFYVSIPDRGLTIFTGVNDMQLRIERRRDFAALFAAGDNIRNLTLNNIVFHANRFTLVNTNLKNLLLYVTTDADNTNTFKIAQGAQPANVKYFTDKGFDTKKWDFSDLSNITLKYK